MVGSWLVDSIFGFPFLVQAMPVATRGQCGEMGRKPPLHRSFTRRRDD
jgi:hypothetical protein